MTYDPKRSLMGTTASPALMISDAKNPNALVIPSDPETLLTREKFATALTAAGFPVSAKTLSTKATRGGGPPFVKFGPRALYPWGPGLAWARSRLTPPRHSTSEGDIGSAHEAA